MAYTVGKIAQLLDIPPSTIRFYDKKGLLPFVERSRGGVRQFTEEDRARMENILLLRRFGFSVEEIRDFVQLEEQGPATRPQRLAILENRGRALEEEIAALQETLSLLEESCRKYRDKG